MKKYGLVALALTLVLSISGLTGCKSETESGNGGGYDTGDAELDEALSKVDNYDPTNFVELGDYKGIEVDTSASQDDIDSAIMNLLSEKTSVKQIKKGKVKEGDTVTVIAGAWEGTVGMVQSVNASKQSLTINVELFGRETPVEISFAEVKQM